MSGGRSYRWDIRADSSDLSDEGSGQEEVKKCTSHGQTNGKPKDHHHQQVLSLQIFANLLMSCRELCRSAVQLVCGSTDEVKGQAGIEASPICTVGITLLWGIIAIWTKCNCYVVLVICVSLFPLHCLTHSLLCSLTH